MLISSDYEHEFLTSFSQQKILKKLALVKAEDFMENYPDICNACNKPFKSIIIKIAHVLSNIFLNNYTKNRSDQASVSNTTEVSSRKNRKLLTFSK